MTTTGLVRQQDVPTTGKTNERPGTRAVARHIRVSAYKAREVLDLIRDRDVATADEILRFSERDIAIVIRKVLGSAVANAMHNDDQIPEDLFVAACFADEGKTLRRMRPRARGRSARIRKRTCHITVIVARMPEAELERRRLAEASRPGSRAARRAGQQQAEDRRRRLRRSRQAEANPEPEHDHDHDHEGHDHGDHEGHDHEHDEPTADDVMAEAEAEAAGSDAHPLSDHDVAEIESGGVELPEEIGMDDQLPGGDDTTPPADTQLPRTDDTTEGEK
jgi:large subunit ribosomal protein L22